MPARCHRELSYSSITFGFILCLGIMGESDMCRQAKARVEERSDEQSQKKKRHRGMMSRRGATEAPLESDEAKLSYRGKRGKKITRDDAMMHMKCRLRSGEAMQVRERCAQFGLSESPSSSSSSSSSAASTSPIPPPPRPFGAGRRVEMGEIEARP
jgi:hypothetical protein